MKQSRGGRRGGGGKPYTFHFNVDLELVEAGRRKAEAEDLTLSHVMRRFLRRYVAGEAAVPVPAAVPRTPGRRAHKPRRSLSK